MAKWQLDLILDQALNYIKNNGTRIYVCNAQPANFADASVNFMLAGKTGLTSGDYTGPGDGDVSGRKIRVNAQSSINVTNTGDATHIAVCSETVLLLVTTCTLKTLIAGDQVNIPAFDDEIADAS